MHIKDFARAFHGGEELSRFIASFPDILAGRDFKEFLGRMQAARKSARARIFGIGAHVIKTGLNPVLIQMLKDGWITMLALNGAGVIHDFEIAAAGHTSEDVAQDIQDGRFGMTQETAEILNETIHKAKENDMGFGEAVGQMIAESSFPHKDMSLIGQAYSLGIPVTVHVAIGTDTVHFHPTANGEAIGKASLLDFQRFCSHLEGLEGGGVFANFGSAVILPEVFLKGVSFVRNRGILLEDFAAAVFDFQRHYRPEMNVIRRPLGKKGRGYYFIGHHEIMIPLLAAGLGSFDQKSSVGL
ncbi:MAG: hypothetical protein ACE5LV_05430 [Candidatus Aminicenantales bacterium]